MSPQASAKLLKKPPQPQSVLLAWRWIRHFYSKKNCRLSGKVEQTALHRSKVRKEKNVCVVVVVALSW